MTSTSPVGFRATTYVLRSPSLRLRRMLATEGDAPLGGTSFDVSSQYLDMRRGFLPVYAVLTVGGLAVMLLVWAYVHSSLAGPTGRYAFGILLLVASCLTGTGAFVKWIEHGYAVRAIRVDKVGVHVVGIHGSTRQLAWASASFDLWFGEHTPARGVRSSPPIKFLTVRGLGLPVYFEVPVGVLEATLREAEAHSLDVESHAEEHRGKYGIHYWWVTTVRAPPKPAVRSTRTERGGSVSSDGRTVSSLP